MWEAGKGFIFIRGVWCNAKVGDSDLGGFNEVLGGPGRGLPLVGGCLVHHVGGR